MGDIDNTDPVPAQLPDDAEEVFDFPLGEGRRRFVHDEDAGLGAQGARDLDQLLLGHGEVADFGFRVDRSPDPVEQRAGVAAALTPADPAPRAAGFEPQRDILGHGEVGEEGRLLIDGRDPQCPGGAGVIGLHDLAGDGERPAIGRVGAGNNLDERRFAGTVLADQRMDLAGPEIERDAAQGADAAE